MYCLSPPMTEPPEGKSTLYSVSMFLNARSFFSLSKVVSIGKIPRPPYLVEFHHCAEMVDGNSSNINHIRLDSDMNSSQKSQLLNSCDVCVVAMGVTSRCLSLFHRKLELSPVPGSTEGQSFHISAKPELWSRVMPQL